MGLFVPPDDFATATAGNPESVARNLNSGRRRRQFSSAKLVESFGDTRPGHKTSVGDAGVSDDLPSGMCRETYIPLSRRLLRERLPLETPTRVPEAIGGRIRLEEFSKAEALGEPRQRFR